MWLNRCGANADSRFMGIPDYLDGPSFSGRLAFGQALEFPSSLGPVSPADSRPTGMLAYATYTKPEEGEFIWGNYSLVRSQCWLRGRDSVADR